jgi:hypothetical protein
MMFSVTCWTGSSLSTLMTSSSSPTHPKNTCSMSEMFSSTPSVTMFSSTPSVTIASEQQLANSLYLLMSWWDVTFWSVLEQNSQTTSQWKDALQSASCPRSDRNTHMVWWFLQVQCFEPKLKRLLILRRWVQIKRWLTTALQSEKRSDIPRLSAKSKFRARTTHFII